MQTRKIPRSALMGTDHSVGRRHALSRVRSIRTTDSTVSVFVAASPGFGDEIGMSVRGFCGVWNGVDDDL
jgi:hypothetical protein